MTNSAHRFALLHFQAKQHNSLRENQRGGILFNLLAFLIVTSAFILVGWGASMMTVPIEQLKLSPITLDPADLVIYSLRTTLRMLAAVCCSLVFSLAYASLAAKNRYAEQILVPLLDVLQSVPILGYISFTVTGFLSLFPGSVLGAECAVIFAIFTSQVWNMTFSLYQSLKSVPAELNEAAAIFKLSPWQKFWRMEVPFGTPNLIWNVAVSMSGGWFFVVASEVISVGDEKITLPGIGSYIALALTQMNIPAIFYAIGAMSLIIVFYNQLMITPLVAWADKFKTESNKSISAPSSWVLVLFHRNLIVKKLFLPIKYLASFLLYSPLFNGANSSLELYQPPLHKRLMDYLWYSALFTIGIVAGYYVFNFLHNDIGVLEIFKVFKFASITMLRVVVLVIIASIVWVPIGIYIGLHPKVAAIAQPIAQFLAAFPANLLFPVAVIYITRYHLNPEIWVGPLMIMGTQWLILFNVIAGTMALPNDLREAASNLNLKGWLWCTKLILPAITPYYLTGAITASGNAWNASIVAEVIRYGDQTITATGLGSYIAQMTVGGDFRRVVLGVGMMSLFVVVFNHFFWRPLYNYATKKFQLLS